MIEIILHDICDTFPYLKYGLAAAVCTALALTVLNHSRIMDKEKRSNYVSLLGKSMFLAFYGAVLLQVTLLSREPGSRTAADLIPFSTWGTTAQSRAHEIENMIMFLPVGVFLPMLHRGLREFRTAVQEYGRVLTEHMPEIKKIATVLGRGEKVKELIEETAAELAFNNDPSLASGNVCYYYEKISMLPNFWAQTNNFKRLLSLFDRNLMFIRDVHDVCKKFNGLSRCKGNCKKCDAIHHPFSMLYKLGMLGIIPTSLNREGYVTQEFLDSTKVTYITGNDLLNVNNDCIYVLHPALTKSIDKLQRKKIKHFNLFVLGKGMSVPQDKLDKPEEGIQKFKELLEILVKYKANDTEAKFQLCNNLFCIIDAESEEEIELREMLMEQIKDEPATVEYVHNFLTNREEK